MPQVKTIYKCVHRESDRLGNQLSVWEEPINGLRKFYLHITGENKPRLIGEGDRESRTMFIKRDRNRHFVYQMHSYGFCYKVIREATKYTHVLLQVRNGNDFSYYLIPRKFIMESGVVKEFSKQGFEIQVFLRTEYLDNFKTEEKFIPSKLLPS